MNTESQNKLESKIEFWKNRLLDLKKSNRLLHFRENPKSNITFKDNFQIGVQELYKLIIQGKPITLPFPFPGIIENEIVDGEISNSKKSTFERTLKTLKQKANTSLQEQGINTLYVAFGFLKWFEVEHSEVEILSPLILVPVNIIMPKSNDEKTFTLELRDDEIVFNPTLRYKLFNDFGLEFLDFDNEITDILKYFHDFQQFISNDNSRRNWEILQDKANLSILSFQKISMFGDLKNNHDKILAHPFIGEKAQSRDIESGADYKHDDILPRDIFQVLDADSSQQDAILLSKAGKSFVLQGPPGTGKSQTITNIIAENLALGKTVLFVSEKMAALNVVYERLKSVNLHDFCLPLHNHKANRKEIVEQLEQTLNLDKNKIKDEAFENLHQLNEKRAKLNSFDAELHKKRNPLSKSVYETYGVLAKIQVPHKMFQFEGVEKISIQEYNAIKKAVNEYAQSYSPSLITQENPWLHSNFIEYSLEDKTVIFDCCNKLYNSLLELNSFFENSQIIELFGHKHQISINYVEQFIEILSHFEDFPNVNYDWFYLDSIEELKSRACKLKQKSDELRHLRSNIIENYTDEVLSLEIDISVEDVEKSLSHLNANIQDLTNKDLNFVIGDIVRIRNITKQHLDKFSEIDRGFQVIYKELGIAYPNNMLELDRFTALINLIIKEIHPVEGWFNTSTQILIEKFKKIKNKHERLNQLHNQVLEDCNEKVFEIDAFPILQRFRTDYKNILKHFNQQYKKDRKFILGFAKKQDDDTDEKILDILNRLQEIKETIGSLENENKEILNTFGTRYYQGKNTNWDSLEGALIHFGEICKHFPHAFPKNLKEYLLNEAPLNYNLPPSDFFKELLVTFTVINDKTPFSEMFNLLQNIYKSTEFIDCYNNINNYSKKTINHNETIKLIDNLSKYQSTQSQINELEQYCKNNFDTFYLGIETDWDSVLKILSNTIELRRIKEKYKISEKFIEKLCNQDETLCDNLLKEAKEIKELRTRFAADLIVFKSWFDEDYSDYSISDLVNKVYRCKENLDLLDKTVRYYKEKIKCKSEKLEAFITLVEKEKLQSNVVLDTFIKHFCVLWLDYVTNQNSVLKEFSLEKIEALRSEFCKLDKEQLQIAKERVRCEIIAQMPAYYDSGEVLILKKEVNKKKKFLPPRRLFKEIPRLLTKLKPCLMMSPLSVSYFLEADKFNFDLVVFDEASQIYTEDSIGAIIRSKQVIIVGDDKQLPPTDFFKKNGSNDDEDNDDDAYESILTEAKSWGVFEKSLLWHYRSRHEDLIAFSNHKIYNKKLITFPSASERGKDIGVEYIYVPNGIYDKGGSTNNIIEAQKVAQLVIEHFRNNPTRSLGVVTFSESQRECIENCVERIKKENPSLQNLFLNDDLFFIKNIENVQGDERDTIIFSIGYGKSSDGKFSQNFGPLGNQQGHKRLNVAITRAKFNLKLVGSIEPTDIKLSVDTNEGPRLLRSYIEFAQQGIRALNNEPIVRNSDQFDSPFEESVCEFLREKKYEVKTQIGCSNYRIDMAVLHPKYNQKFVIGIECDGAMYHSSRTARERDRLRQDVLEEMGWKIIRVWSTDWIKNPESQKKRLIAEINKAIESYGSPNMQITETNDEANSYLVEDDFPIKTVDEISLSNTFQVFQSVTEEEILEELNISKSYLAEKYNTINLNFKKIHKEFIRKAIIFILDKETPIHLDLLYQRLVGFYGQSKVTTKIKISIDEILKTVEDKQILDEKFLTKRSESSVVPKKVSPTSVRFKIEYISQEELKQGLLIIAKSRIGLYKKELVKITAREFGFDRMGNDIANAFDSAYNILIEEGLLIESNEGKISV